MGKVVFSEGENDLIFLGLLHRDHRGSLDFDTFNNEKEEKAETKRLTQHEVDQFQYLYKAEGARSKVCQILSDVSLQIRGLNIDLYAMVDLDNDPVGELYEEIDQYLTLDYGNDVSIIENTKSVNDDLCILSCEFEITSGRNVPLEIFAFHESLEEVSGVSRGESKSVKRRKLAKYISTSPRTVGDIVNRLYN